MGTFEDLIEQLDAFIRKFYKNLMIKGMFLFLIIFLFTFLLVSGLEYIGHFNSFVRGFLFFSFIFLNLYVLIRYFLLPLAKLFSFGKRISRSQAAQIVGDFFPTVNDKLLNTLQLQNATTGYSGNIVFLQASIQQNARELNRFSFTKAIDYSTNKRFLKYFLPILFLVILLVSIVPNFYQHGAERVLNYNSIYAIAPDYTFHLENKHLLVEEGSDVVISVTISPKPGKAIPNQIFIVNNEGTFLMQKSAKNQATFKIKNVNKNTVFYFKVNNNNSKEYLLKVAKRSSIGYLSVKLIYPKYLGLTNKTISNPGDLIVPEGTQLVWNGTVKNAKFLKVVSKDTNFLIKQTGFRYSEMVYNSFPFYLILKNAKLNSLDTNQFNIDVVKDQYPVINLTK